MILFLSSLLIPSQIPTTTYPLWVNFCTERISFSEFYTLFNVERLLDACADNLRLRREAVQQRLPDEKEKLRQAGLWGRKMHKIKGTMSPVKYFFEGI